MEEIGMAGKVFSGIGGQAVMEGVMMRSKGHYAVAIRLADKTIHIEDKEDDFGKSPWLKVPIIRGMVSFVYSLAVVLFSASYRPFIFRSATASS